EQVGAQSGESHLAGGLADRVLRSGQVGGDVLRDEVRRAALRDLLYVLVEPRRRLDEGDAVASETAAPEQAEAAEPGEHSRGGLAGGAGVGLEHARLAHREP